MIVKKVVFELSLLPPGRLSPIGGRIPVLATKTVELGMTLETLSMISTGEYVIESDFASFARTQRNNVDFTTNPPVFKLTGRMTGHTLDFISRMRNAGWVFNEAQLAYYNDHYFANTAC